MSNFKSEVLRLVRLIPRGRVASYGQIASALGQPRAARQVGWVLRGLAEGELAVPWWRVLNQKGELSIKGNPLATKNLQKILLEKDGVKVEKDFTLNIEYYRVRQI